MYIDSEDSPALCSGVSQYLQRSGERGETHTHTHTHTQDWSELHVGDCLKRQTNKRFSKEDWTIRLDVAERKVKAEVFTGSI